MTLKVPAAFVSAFRARPADANKYSVGTVAVVGGCERYPHAPVIAALGARAAGAGLVQLVVPDASRWAAGALVPEATIARLAPEVAFPRVDVSVVGMGLGISPLSECIVSRLLSGTPGRYVLDADALSLLAKFRTKRRRGVFASKQEVVLTPHEGEAAKLLGWTRAAVASDRRGAAASIVARYGATVVLKGARTLVLSPGRARAYENRTGNPFMALGGMGDLLAGVLGARWAYLQGDAFAAAASAVYLHALASDRVIGAARDPSIVNTASEIGALRVQLDN